MRSEGWKGKRVKKYERKGGGKQQETPSGGGMHVRRVSDG